jgi:hypothetical protein
LWFNALSTADVDESFDIAVDAMGSAYVTGHTRSPDFCTLFGNVPGYDLTYNDNGDAFLLKVKPNGSGLEYCTFIGGNDWDSGTAVAVNAAGQAIITGGTWSPNFPTTANAHTAEIQGLRDSFVFQLNAAGSEIIYSSYLGGSGQDESRGLSIGADGTAVVAGWTNSDDFPTTPNSFDTTYNGAFDGFLVQLTPTLATFNYGAYVGGGDEDRVTAVAIASDNSTFITGHTQSPDFPTTSGTLPSNNRDAFVLHINPAGDLLQYGTRLGGSDIDEAYGLTVDAAGIASVVGSTNSADFPTTATSYQPELQGDTDAFVMQLSPSGQTLFYSSFLGGSDVDWATAVTFNAQKQLILTGATRSDDFPITTNAYDSQIKGDYDIFITRLRPPVLHTQLLPVVLRKSP